MNLRNLQLFLDSYSLGGFAASARRNGVAPSAVSRAVAALEADLGVRLFHRSTRRLEPTEAGEQLQARGRALVADAADLADAVSDMEGAPRGLLRLSASTSFGQAVLLPILASFRAGYPGIRIVLDLTNRRVDVLGERIDVAIRHGRLDDSDLVARKLRDVRYHLLASKDYLAQRGEPTTPDALNAPNAHDLLSFPYPGFARMWRLRGSGSAAQDVAVLPALTASSALALRAAARSGMGVALLPDWLGPQDLMRVLPDWYGLGPGEGAALWQITPARRHRPARVEAFLAHLHSALPVRTPTP